MTERLISKNMSNLQVSIWMCKRHSKVLLNQCRNLHFDELICWLQSASFPHFAHPLGCRHLLPSQRWKQGFLLLQRSQSGSNVCELFPNQNLSPHGFRTCCYEFGTLRWCNYHFQKEPSICVVVQKHRGGTHGIWLSWSVLLPPGKNETSPVLSHKVCPKLNGKKWLCNQKNIKRNAQWLQSTDQFARKKQLNESFHLVFESAHHKFPKGSYSRRA